MSLQHRRRQPELMDDPALDDSVHHDALIGLRRVNWFSRTAPVLECAILQSRPASAISAQDQAIHILDIASGGGDLAIQLATRFQRRNIDVQIEGCDISPLAVSYAAQQAERANCTNIRFFRHNILADELPIDSYDVVMCSLFMHHLDEPDILRLLQIMRQTSRNLVLIDDLQRSRPGYWLAWLGCRLLTRCHVVHVDGPLSVQGALTVSEAANLARKAGLTGVQVTTHWPERFLISWRSPS